MEAAMPAALELLPEPAGFRFALEEEELLEAAEREYWRACAEFF